LAKVLVNESILIIPTEKFFAIDKKPVSSRGRKLTGLDDYRIRRGYAGLRTGTRAGIRGRRIESNCSNKSSSVRELPSSVDFLFPALRLGRDVWGIPFPPSKI
jgi:hypothetical protein